MPYTPKNILIIKVSALGDIALALPALNALRLVYAQTRITWMVRPEFAPLIRDHPQLDDILFFDRKNLGKSWRSWQSLRDLWRLGRELRSGQFDCVFDFQGLLRTALLGRWTGATIRIGMANAREGAPLFYSRRIESDPDAFHLIDHYQRMVQAVYEGVLPKPDFVFPASAAAENAAHRLLEDHHMLAKGYAVFIAGSAHEDKCWPAAHFADLAERIQHTYNMPILAPGTASERPAIEEIKTLTKANFVNCAGQTSLPELVALLRNASLVISNDTGPGHIAAGLGVPLVMLFSWSNPARIYPYQRPQCIAAIDPFGRGQAIKSRDPQYNVRNIMVDQVFELVCQQMDDGRQKTED